MGCFGSLLGLSARVIWTWAVELVCGGLRGSLCFGPVMLGSSSIRVDDGVEGELR